MCHGTHGVTRAAGTGGGRTRSTLGPPRPIVNVSRSSPGTMMRRAGDSSAMKRLRTASMASGWSSASAAGLGALDTGGLHIDTGTLHIYRSVCQSC